MLVGVCVFLFYIYRFVVSFGYSVVVWGFLRRSGRGLGVFLGLVGGKYLWLLLISSGLGILLC